MSTAKVTSRQRHTRQNPCPICTGNKDLQQGKGIRCAGFTSGDEEWAYCTREEYAGSLDLNYKAKPPAYLHKLRGPCRCGATHGDASNEQRRSTRQDDPWPVHPELGVPDRVFPAILDSKALALHCRWDLDDGGKTYRWYRNGRWTLGDVRPEDLPLYGLPDLRRFSADAPAVFTEGEPAARALLDHGIAAVSSYGADVIPSLDSLVPLRGRRVILWADNSETGNAHMGRIGEQLELLGISSRIFTLADFPHEADAVDYFAAEKTGEDARALLAVVLQQEEPSWDDPLPLPGGLLPPVPAFDATLLPLALRDWVRDIALRMQVPMDFVAAPAIVVLGALIGRRVGIFPKKHDREWVEVANLWGAIVGLPGVLKSPVLRQVMRPLDRLVAEAQEDHAQRLSR
jgi:hypothetical protein